MSDENSGNNYGGLLMAFVVGAAAGAAVALLSTPKSGPELRASIGEGINGVRNRVGGLVADRV